MFHSVTPLLASAGTATTLAITLRTEGSRLTTIHRTLPQLLHLHRRLLLLHPPDIHADFSFLHTPDLGPLPSTQRTSLCHSVLSYLNSLTRSDAVLFSEELHSFLFSKSTEQLATAREVRATNRNKER